MTCTDLAASFSVNRTCYRILLKLARSGHGGQRLATRQGRKRIGKMSLAKVGIPFQTFWIAMARLSHNLSVGPTGLDQRRDKFMPRVVEAEVTESEPPSNTIESGFQRVFRDQKHAAVYRARKCRQNLDSPRRKADRLIEHFFRRARIFDAS
jgi:hypothetical protein